MSCEDQPPQPDSQSTHTYDTDDENTTPTPPVTSTATPTPTNEVDTATGTPTTAAESTATSDSQQSATDGGDTQRIAGYKTLFDRLAHCVEENRVGSIDDLAATQTPIDSAVSESQHSSSNETPLQLQQPSLENNYTPSQQKLLEVLLQEASSATGGE